MEINISNQCSEDENEMSSSNSGQTSKQPETMSSSNDAKHDKTTTTSSVYAKTFVSVQSFKTRDEFLSAMIEDVTEWLNSLFNLDIKSHELMHHLDTGVLLCRLANILEGLMVDEKRDPDDDADRETPAKSKDEGGGRGATSDDVRRSVATRPLVAISGNGGAGSGGLLVFRENASRGSFQSRDNISNFLNWCRNRLKLADTVLFETEDLVAGRNERNVILCLLEVARQGSKHGMIVPELIELETEIDAELDEESMAEDEAEVERLAQEVEEEEDDDDDDEETDDDDDDQSDGSEMEHANSASDLGAPCEAAASAAVEEKEGSIEEVSEAMVSALLEGSRNEVELTTTDRNDPEVTTTDRNDPEVTTSDRNDLKLTTSYLVSSGATAGSSSPRAGLCLRLHDLLRMHEHRRSEIQRCMRHSIQVDMLTLDELVRRFLGNCRCQHPYPMIKISEGKYRVGDNLMLIFVRMLRNHVMLRIGGGWETLADYLKRHDPCRATSDEHHRRGATHTCTHAILENAPWNDDTTIHSNVTSGTPSEEEDISTAEKRENMQERDEDKPTEEDKDKTEKGKTATEKEENAPEDDEEMHETTDSTTKQPEQTLNGSTEKHISA